MQHVQPLLDHATIVPIVSFAADELSFALLEAPPESEVLVSAIEIEPNAETSAAPADQAGSPWSANVAIVSDYRIAGVTSSGHGGALQAGVDYESQSGWSAGLWASTISITEGSNLEVDLYGAKSFAFGDGELSLGGVLIVLPGGNNAAVAMVTTSVSAPVGPVDATLAARYAWPQGNIDYNDDFYVSLNGKSPIGSIWGADLTLSASVGFERGEFAVEEKKLDWSVSLTANVGGVDIGFSYVDTDLRDEAGDAGCVLSITRTF